MMNKSCTLLLLKRNKEERVFRVGTFSLSFLQVVQKRREKQLTSPSLLPKDNRKQERSNKHESETSKIVLGTSPIGQVLFPKASHELNLFFLRETSGEVQVS